MHHCKKSDDPPLEGRHLAGEIGGRRRATPRGLAAFAEQGNEHAALVGKLLGDESLMKQPQLSCVPFCPQEKIDEKQKICYAAFMKATITVTSRGVVTLPLCIRKALGIKADDTLIAETTPDGLLLRPAVTLPVEIYNDKRIRVFDEAEDDLAQAMRRTPPASTKSARRR